MPERVAEHREARFPEHILRLLHALAPRLDGAAVRGIDVCGFGVVERYSHAGQVFGRGCAHDPVLFAVLGELVRRRILPPLMVMSACIRRLPSCAGKRTFSVAPNAFL